MKKSSLMGASVVAAALLAAAPVVAPVASLATPGTQVVKADVSPGTSEVAKKISAMGTDTTITEKGNSYGQLDDFTKQLSTIDALGSFRENQHQFVLGTETTNTKDPFLLKDGTNSLQLNDGLIGVEHKSLKTSDLLKYFFNGQNQVNLVSDTNLTAAKNMSYTIQFKYSSAIGTQSYDINSDDLSDVTNDLKDNGGTVTMLMQLYDGEHNKIPSPYGLLKSTISYKVNNNRAAYVNYADTLSAHVGDSASIYNLSNSFMNANGKITDYNGNDITTAAYNKGAIEVSQLLDANGHEVAGAAVNGNFTKPGQYYQRVKIDLKKIFGDQATNWGEDDWKAAVNGGLISVNGQTPSLTNADANVFLASKNTTVDTLNAPQGSLVLKRTVNVDADQGAFKSEKVSGIVTVNMNNGMAAQVYDENGKMVLGRALPNKSAWKTGEKRTYYKNGQVFYQVSTNEYVRAQDVTFSEPFQDSVVRGDVTITKYPDQVIATKNDDHYSIVYALDSDGNGFHMTSRALAGNTKWRNGAKAVVNGKTFYQISTNEWLNSGSLAD